MNVRPSVPNYQEVSAIFQQHIQTALYGEKTPKQALSDAVQMVKGLK
jgi:multiple sugar transport system substrate-binding protein